MRNTIFFYLNFIIIDRVPASWIEKDITKIISIILCRCNRCRFIKKDELSSNKAWGVITTNKEVLAAITIKTFEDLCLCLACGTMFLSWLCFKLLGRGLVHGL